MRPGCGWSWSVSVRQARSRCCGLPDEPAEAAGVGRALR